MYLCTVRIVQVHIILRCSKLRIFKCFEWFSMILEVFLFFHRGGNCSKFDLSSLKFTQTVVYFGISFNISIFWLGSYHINLWNSMVFFHFVCTDQSIEVNIYHNDMAKFSIHASKRWSKKLLYTLDGYIWPICFAEL